MMAYTLPASIRRLKIPSCFRVEWQLQNTTPTGHFDRMGDLVSFDFPSSRSSGLKEYRHSFVHLPPASFMNSLCGTRTDFE
mmetsp:Transcript_11832/g.34742  ORF Transcript_11832/g.34742 Transcript_11832/m.34742 type:complete len:81 (+) Transcript_11832:2820-3062(+)